MKKYKFITIKQLEIAGTLETFSNKPVYRIFNNKSGTELGNLFYNFAWRQYVFSGYESSIWNKSCLLDVIDFIGNEIGK